MPILEQTGSDFERVHIPANTYKAKVASIRAGEINDLDNPGQKKRVLWWAFEIAGKSKTVAVEGMTTFAYGGEKAKASKWARAILNTEPPSTLDTDDLIGLPCRVVVVDKDKDGTTYSRVDNVISAQEGEL